MLLERYRERSQDVIDRKRAAPDTKPTMPAVTFTYAAASTFGGTAVRLPNGERFIAITVGSIAILQHTFLRLMACAEVFPTIGDLPADKPPQITLTDVEQLLVENNMWGPGCPIRRTYAEIATICAFRHLVAHELCHHRHGHLDWKPTQPITKLTYNALEFDADCFAACEVISLAQEIARNAATSNRPEVAPYVSGDDNVARLALFSMWVLFAIARAWRTPSTAELDSASDLPARTRLLFAIGNMTQYCLEFGSNLAPILWSTAEEVAAVVDAGLECILEKHVVPERRFSDPALDAAIHEYLIAVNLEWRRIRPDMMECTYSKILAY